MKHQSIYSQNIHNQKPKLDFLTSAIRWCFYILFFCLPLLMYPHTYELFEFNKMWFVFMISLVILFLWTSKSILQRKIQIIRTPLDIPLLLFLASQFLSTIFSIEPHVSFWGYYSRFNGGFLSTLCYIFLYYAFISNVWQKSSDELHKYFGTTNKKLFLAGTGIVGFCFLYILWLGPELSNGFSKKEDIISFNNFVVITSLLASIPFFIKSLRFSPAVKIIFLSLISGVIVALWGFPSHFGYDPTCFTFRATLDVSCWTEAFQPKIRIFSTLGQPNWLAAHLSLLIPITIALGIIRLKGIFKSEEKNHESRIKHQGLMNNALPSLFLILASLFYLDLLWTGSQSGFLGLWTGIIVFLVLIVIFLYLTPKIPHLNKNNLSLILTGFIFIFLLITFFFSTPIQKINEYTWPALSKKYFAPQQSVSTAVKTPETAPAQPALEANITASGNIRKIVWEGAVKIFQQYPLFGSGPETFAYAYYKVRPTEHNLTSEWDYLYNKAHNEYLNYLATSGIFGLGTYLLMIGWFLWTAIKYLWTIVNGKLKPDIDDESFNIKQTNQSSIIYFLPLALLAAYISILISNFFGFSVVTINLFLFFIPALFYTYIYPSSLRLKEFSFNKSSQSYQSGPESIFTIVIIGIVVLYLEILLIMFWQADINYAFGNNYDKAGRSDLGTEFLEKAVSLRTGEDTFRDELAINYSTLALAYLQNQQATQGAELMRRAKELSDEVILNHPNNIPFLKSRTRVLYTAAQFNSVFLSDAIKTIEHATSLAPTDAKIFYNLALLYEQAGKRDDAIRVMEKTVQLKPNYRDARFALAGYYSLKSNDLQQSSPTLAQKYLNKSITQLEYLLSNINPKDEPAQELLKSLK